VRLSAPDQPPQLGEGLLQHFIGIAPIAGGAARLDLALGLSEAV
jgi:hypothetical protein